MIIKLSDDLHFHLDESQYSLPKEISWALDQYRVPPEEVSFALPVYEHNIGYLKVYCTYLAGRQSSQVLSGNSLVKYQYLLVILTGQIPLTLREFEKVLFHIDTGYYPTDTVYKRELVYLATLATHAEQTNDINTKVQLHNQILPPVTMNRDYYKELAHFCNVRGTMVCFDLEKYIKDFGYPEPTFYTDRLNQYLEKAFNNRTAFNLLLALRLKLELPLFQHMGGIHVDALLNKIERNPQFFYTNLTARKYNALEDYLGL